MLTELQELRLEVKEALEDIWFLESIDEVERTDITVSLRLHIRPMLFVHVFLGTKSGSLVPSQFWSFWLGLKDS